MQNLNKNRWSFGDITLSRTWPSDLQWEVQAQGVTKYFFKAEDAARYITVSSLPALHSQVDYDKKYRAVMHTILGVNK